MKVKLTIMIEQALKRKLDQEAKKKELTLDELISIRCGR